MPFPQIFSNEIQCNPWELKQLKADLICNCKNMWGRGGTAVFNAWVSESTGVESLKKGSQQYIKTSVFGLLFEDECFNVVHCIKHSTDYLLDTEWLRPILSALLLKLESTQTRLVSPPSQSRIVEKA